MGCRAASVFQNGPFSAVLRLEVYEYITGSIDLLRISVGDIPCGQLPALLTGVAVLRRSALAQGIGQGNQVCPGQAEPVRQAFGQRRPMPRPYGRGGGTPTPGPLIALAPAGGGSRRHSCQGVRLHPHPPARRRTDGVRAGLRQGDAAGGSPARTPPRGCRP